MRKLGKFAAAAIGALVLVALAAPGSAPPAGASETTVIMYWGTYTVAGNDQTPVFYTEPSTFQKPCTDCYITSMTPELEVYDAAGGGNWIVANQDTIGPPARLHHMVVFNHAQTDATCASDPLFSQLGDRFFASGDERGSLVFPAGFGYYIPPAGAGNYWNMQVMIHNQSFNTQVFRLRMTFKYEPTDDLKGMRHLWLDVNNCLITGSSYPVGMGYDDRHWDWTVSPTVEGKIVMMGGHVHDYGVSVAATKGTGASAPLICTATGAYASGSPYAPATVPLPPAPLPAHPADAMELTTETDPPSDPAYLGHIEAMSGCIPDMVIPPGDTIRLHSQYNAVQPIPDVMGIMGTWLYDNCPVSNPDQTDFDADDLGDPCDPDIDGDAILNGSDPEADGDGLDNSLETACGSNSLHSASTPERTDPAMAGSDEDRDGAVDEPLPGGAGSADCDGDGFTGTPENAIYAGSGGRDQDPCGGNGWPADLVGGGTSENAITLPDIGSFFAPVNYFNTNVDGVPVGDNRWDLVPGGVGFHINIQDIGALLAGATGNPPMLGGVMAFNGPSCPWPP